MRSTDSRTFKSGNSEAIRLPKAMGFGLDVELTLVRSGDVLTIYPKRPSVRALVDQLANMPRPNQVEVRETDALDERAGL
jgi:antitoxin VapB